MRTSIKSASALAALVVLQLTVLVAVRALGFSHVSDDDFSRVVIAQTWVDSPRLDPSGSSWLPFPFWWTGVAMLVVGRSLFAARAIALGSNVLATALLFVTAQKRLGSTRATWFTATCAFLPWSVWTAATTTPEYTTLCLVGIGLLGMGAAPRDAGPDRFVWAGGLATALACFSRYEAWPIALVLMIAAVGRLPNEYGRSRLSWGLAAATAGAAPALWLGWNVHAHGDALHFFRRVSTFRHATTQESSLLTRLSFYPGALVNESPELLVLFAMALAFGALSVSRSRARLPVVAFGAVCMFHAIGSAGDGAPTHHPTRALLVLVPCVLAAIALSADGIPAGPRTRLVQAMGVILIAVCANSYRRVPSTSAEESRVRALRLGEALRRDDDAHVVLIPCAYEHFATIAAFGFPERVTIAPRPGVPPKSCPMRVSGHDADPR